MKDENIFWLLLWTIVVIGIVVISISGMFYNNSKNEKILKAESCIKAVLIEGDGYGRALPLCGLIKGE